jgi:hypothetical protein
MHPPPQGLPPSPGLRWTGRWTGNAAAVAKASAVAEALADKLAAKECRVQNRKQDGNDKVGVTVDGVDAVDGVDLNGSARTPAQPPPFDTPTLRALSSSLRKE